MHDLNAYLDNVTKFMHPFVKILCFIMLLLLLTLLSYQLTLLLSLLVSAFALKLQFNKFIRVVKRMRWLFVSIFIIYAFGTSGEYVQYFSGNYAPTYEGCVLGTLQIAKLLIALASLTILFASSSQEHLMIGLYMMLSPLKLLGFEIDRFTARLLLTLDYVEELVVKEKFTLSFHNFDKLHLSAENLPKQKVIVLQSPPFKLIDKLLMITIIVSVLVLAIFRVFT